MKAMNDKWSALFYRWFCSTNAKDIGMMYLVFARWSGVIATTMSLLIRMEQRSTGPGVQAGNGQQYNVLITAHGLLMLFFVVMPALMGGFGNYFLSNSSMANAKATIVALLHKPSGFFCTVLQFPFQTPLFVLNHEKANTI